MEEKQDVDLYETWKAQYGRLRRTIAASVADHELSFRDVRRIIGQFSSSATAIAARLDVPVAERERLVIEATLRFWNEELAPRDLPGPDALLDPLIRASLPVVLPWLFEQAAWIDEVIKIPV